jgi:hypothetical protein
MDGAADLPAPGKKMRMVVLIPAATDSDPGLFSQGF